MSMTYDECAALIKHTVGKTPPIPAEFIVNMAGEFLFGLRKWRFLIGPRVTLDKVADQDYIVLPRDFRSLLRLLPTSGLTDDVRMTTHSELLKLITTPVTVAFSFWGVIVTDATELGDDNAPTPRVDIWPTPVSTELGFFSLYYRRGWFKVSAKGDRLRIPEWIEPLFVYVMFEFARGLIEEDKGRLDDRLKGIKDGELYKTAVALDMPQPEHGVIRNGAGRRGIHPNAHLWNFKPVAGPS